MFAYVKATEGTGFTSSTMASQVAGAKAQGILVGLYHYARPDLHPNITGSSSADTEAAYFWSVASPYIKNGGQYLIPMLDWEAPGVTNTALNQTTLSQWLNEWCNTISNNAKASGITMKVLVYSGTWFCAPGSPYNGGLNSTVTQWPNAMSGYPSNPNAQTGAPSTSPWSTFTIWQYADTNWSGGDSDVFNGTTNQLLQTLVIGGNGGPIITNDIDSVVTNVGANVTFTVALSTNTPYTFRWYSNQVNVATTTTSSYTVTNVQLSSAGNYYVTISNSVGIATSSTAYISVIAPFANGANANMIPTGYVDLYPCEATCTDLFGANTYGPNGYFNYGTGKIGRGWKFNGSNTYLTNNAASLAVPWTLSLWVNRQNAPGASAGLLSDGTRSVKLEQYNGTRQVGLTVFGVGDYNFGYSTPASTWTHLVLIGTSTGTSLYANGSLVGSLTNSMPLPRNHFGGDYLTSTGTVLDYMLGSVDEVLIFNRALSTTEISTLYNGGSGALVRVPEITSVGINSAGTQFQLNLRGLPAKGFSVYRTSDLINWTNLGHVANTSGALTYFDLTTTSAQNSYKVFQP
jgi:GH25 family lysozyme M1 (1,4-beta-N-acetylmuramidase)